LSLVTSDEAARYTQWIQDSNYKVVISGSQATETELTQQGVMFKVGNALLRIIHYIPHYLGNRIIFYEVFARGQR
jgi:hypothetical protein